MATPAESETLACRDAARWEAWLARHHEGSSGVWLLIAKKGSEKTSVTIREALDVALCYGWIDSQRRSHDADFYLQRYSRRRPRSPWSKLNVERAEALIAAGRMRPAGLAEVVAAKKDGRWAAAYESQRTAKLPPVFAAALRRNERARAAFERLDRTGQYTVILPILKAVSPSARASRLHTAIAQLDGSKRGRGR